MAPHELKEGFRKTYAEAKTAWDSALERRLRVKPKADKDQNEKQRI
jgi:hypothetical protein